MRRLVLSAVALLTVVGLVLSGCAPTPVPAPTKQAVGSTPVPAATKPAPTAAPTGPVEITFWNALSGNNGKVMEALVTRYNASQQDVKVNLQFQGNYNETEQKFLAAVAASAVPDLVMVERSRIPGLAAAGALRPLDDFINGPDGLDIKDFIAALVERHTDGKLYSLPQSRSMPVFFYNKDLFKAAGLDDSQAPATWDELKAAAQKLTTPDGSVVGFGLQSGGSWWYFQAAVEQNGGEVSDPKTREVKFNEPAAVEALTWWYNLVYTDKVAKVVGGAGYDSWGNLEAEFISGKVAMMFISTGNMANIQKNAKFRVGVGPLPGGKAGRAAPTGGNAVLIPAGSPPAKAAAAWKFYKWLTDTEQVVEWSMGTGYMPTRTSALNHPKFVEFVKQNPGFGECVKQLEFARPVPSIIQHPKTQTVVEAMYEKIFVGRAPIKQSLDETAAEIAQLMKELK